MAARFTEIPGYRTPAKLSDPSDHKLGDEEAGPGEDPDDLGEAGRLFNRIAQGTLTVEQAVRMMERGIR